MPHLPFQPAEGQAQGVETERPVETADSLTLFKQAKLGFDLASLLAEARTHQQQADFIQNRPMIAGLLLLAHELGVLAEEAIDRCVEAGWQETYKLHVEAKAAIIASLCDEAASVAGDRFDGHDFENLHLSFAGGNYLYVATGMRFSQFDLTRLDAGLGRAVYGCLHWVVREIGFGLMGDDLHECEMMLTDELDEFSVLRSAHPKMGYAQMASLIVEKEIYPFYESWEDEESIAERLGFVESVLDNSANAFFGPVPDMGWVQAETELWRQTNHPNCHAPWARFIEAAVNAWQGCPTTPFRLETCEGEYGCQSALKSCQLSAFELPVILVVFIPIFALL